MMRSSRSGTFPAIVKSLSDIPLVPVATAHFEDIHLFDLERELDILEIFLQQTAGEGRRIAAGRYVVG